LDLGDGTYVVTVLSIRDGVVRLGIDAEKHLPVHRGEIARRIRKLKKKGNTDVGSTDRTGSGPGDQSPSREAG
jgi:carbon storage regulator CsrA